MDTLQRNQLAFEGQSKGFSSQGDTYADEEGLAWMLAELPMSAESEVLDVATGTAEFARALAPHVSSVIGVDATDAMLEQGARFVQVRSRNGRAGLPRAREPRTGSPQSCPG